MSHGTYRWDVRTSRSVQPIGNPTCYELRAFGHVGLPAAQVEMHLDGYQAKTLIDILVDVLSGVKSTVVVYHVALRPGKSTQESVSRTGERRGNLRQHLLCKGSTRTSSEVHSKRVSQS